VMIAVGTPRGNAGAIDLSFIRNAAQAAAPSQSPRTVVPLKSTLTVGTAREGREIRRLARRERMRLALNVRPNCSTISA
jgi:UDP-glucose 6-dehydrogenase